MEFGFLRFKLALEREERRRARALVTDSGLAVGWAGVRPDDRWFGQHLLLDVHVHPHFAAETARLIEALELGDAPVTAYVTADGETRRHALGATGFRRTTVLPDWLRYREQRYDVELWTRGFGGASDGDA
jgi:hypothetical protein